MISNSNIILIAAILAIVAIVAVFGLACKAVINTSKKHNNR
jgi:hypothetical protein